MTAREFRTIALSLPQAVEALTWNVRLRAARKGAVREALITAWRNRAPKRLAEQ
jgi:hypothetical protein